MSAAEGRRRSLLRWLPALAVMALIFALSSISGLRVSDDAAIDGPARVVAHFGIYATLGALLLYALGQGRHPGPRHVLAAFLGAVLYAVSDEIHQAMVPDRGAALDDVVVDALGALLGVIVAWLVMTRHDRSRPATSAARRHRG